MLEHIVKNKETIQDILNIYNIEIDEIINANLHITDIYNLHSGMKIKIPLLNKEVEQILDNTESFVQKYYPKLNDIYDETEEKEVKVNNNFEKKQDVSNMMERRAYPGILPPKKPYKRS